MRGLSKAVILAMIGGIAYCCIELLFRGRTHWTMAVLGGICFVLIGGINEWLPWDMPLWLQGIIGAIIVTVFELVSGVILNLWLDLGIWDYADLSFNLLGQICLVFSLLWAGLSIVAVVVDDWLRYWLFGEDRPHYIFL